MASEFRYQRRVQFHETDQAGIVHFSWYFKYMEEAEHALWRSVGMSIAPPEPEFGFPRVNATCDFKAPLRFEDEIEVHIAVETIGRRSIRYACTLRRGAHIVATGSMTSACVTLDPNRGVQSIDVPDSVRVKLNGGHGL
ncbi:MAG TPA: thioesterase family protein [Vicinamibacterales bacterium]|nr:thioesterase family protein [Vicinamibacterales bacterium]